MNRITVTPAGVAAGVLLLAAAPAQRVVRELSGHTGGTRVDGGGERCSARPGLRVRISLRIGSPSGSSRRSVGPVAPPDGSSPG